VRILLAGDLLFGREDGLDRAEVDVHHPRVRALLDDARDDVALAAAELAEHGVVGEVAQALVDDLLGRERRDPAEVARGVLGLADDVALLVVLGHVDRDVPGLAIEVRAGALRVRVAVLARVGVLEVGHQDRLLDDLHQFIERDLLLALHHAEHAEVDVHRRPPLFSSSSAPTCGRNTQA
jgi:hypothetical protein